MLQLALLQCREYFAIVFPVAGFGGALLWAEVDSPAIPEPFAQSTAGHQQQPAELPLAPLPSGRDTSGEISRTALHTADASVRLPSALQPPAVLTVPVVVADAEPVQWRPPANAARIPDRTALFPAPVVEVRFFLPAQKHSYYREREVTTGMLAPSAANQTPYWHLPSGDAPLHSFSARIGAL